MWIKNSYICRTLSISTLSTNVKRYLLLPVLAILVLSCNTRPDSSEFLQPQVSECDVEIDGYKATYSCTIRGSAPIRTSGFAVSVNGGAETRTDVALAGDRMTMEVRGLEPGASYSIRAYVSNGRNEVFGPQKGFVIEETDPVVPIPDSVFKEYLLSEFDENGDGQISMFEAELIYGIDVRTDNIHSLEGVEHFKNLEWLTAGGTNTENDKRNGQLRKVDLSANSHLRSIELSINNIEKLKLPRNASRLESLYCWLNRIDTLDVSSCPNLKTIYCWMNQLTGLDVSHNPELEDLRCAQNDFYENGLDVSSNPKLRYLWCNDDELTSIDISHNPLLEEFGCYDNDISSVDLSPNLKLRIVHCENTLISHLNVSMLPDLEELSCGDNRIYEPVDVSKNPKLKRYAANGLRMTCAPDLSHNPHLTQIHISGTGGAEFIGKDFFCSWPNLEGVNFCVYRGVELDLSQNGKLRDVWAGDMPNMKVLDLSASPYLQFICINGSRALEKVYVNDAVDISRLRVEKTDDVTAVTEHKRL